MAASNTHSLTIDKKTERLGWLLDDVFRVPVLGWRFGLDALIGLIPGSGDSGTALASFYILASAVRHGVPKITLLRMGMNIGFDYLLGSLPVVGDVADVFWKSNQKNIALLRRLRMAPIWRRNGAYTRRGAPSAISERYPRPP